MPAGKPWFGKDGGIYCYFYYGKSVKTKMYLKGSRRASWVKAGRRNG